MLHHLINTHLVLFPVLGYHQNIILHTIQLYLELFLTNQYLVITFLDRKEVLNNDDSDKVNILFEFQLDLAIN